MQVLKSSAAPARIIDGADFSIAIDITPVQRLSTGAPELIGALIRSGPDGKRAFEAEETKLKQD